MDYWDDYNPNPLEAIMPMVIFLSALLVIAAVCLLGWRYLGLRAQVQIEQARATAPIHQRVDGLDSRLAEIEGYVNPPPDRSWIGFSHGIRDQDPKKLTG